jgi:Base plate wedge protein 53
MRFRYGPLKITAQELNMANFFKPMPIVYYNGIPCKNITQRTLLTKQVRDSHVAFYEYTLQDGDRPDVVAHKNYGDAFYDWICYYSNGTVDPYHGWFLDEDSFNKYIVSKYGSLAEATERTAYYRVSKSDDTLSTSGYNALTARRKKYWTPYTDDVGIILYYVRISHDLKISTNALVTLTASLNETSLPDFVVGEHVTQTINGVVTAAGDVVRATPTTLDVQHIQGTFVAGNITGMSSDITASIGGATSIGVTIEPDELIYWEQVSCFTHEQELNEQKRKIKMLTPSVATQTVRAHEELLNGLI